MALLTGVDSMWNSKCWSANRLTLKECPDANLSHKCVDLCSLLSFPLGVETTWLCQASQGQRTCWGKRETFLLLSRSLCVLTCSDSSLVEWTLNICNYSVLREGNEVVCVSAIYVSWEPPHSSSYTIKSLSLQICSFLLVFLILHPLHYFLHL